MIVLERIYAPRATLGYLHLADFRMIYSLEPPWRANQLGISCIPEGTYDLVPDPHGKHQWFKIPDEQVAPRSAIELHPANRVDDLRGCIGVGMEATESLHLVRSREACGLIRALLPDGDKILIRQYRPEGVEA